MYIYNSQHHTQSGLHHEIHTFLVACVLPVSYGELKPHVPDDVVAKTGPQSHPVLVGINSHGQDKTCQESD